MKRKMDQRISKALDSLMAAVDNGDSARLRSYLAMLGRFHQYSLYNTLLISAQCPNATHVAGYRRWQKLGRQVRRGEKGIRILAPIVRRKDADDEDAVVAFRSACVFDVQQTDGKPLPELAQADGDPGAYKERLKQLIQARGIKLAYSNRIGPAQGMATGGMIMLRTDMNPAEEFSTLVHEMAHELLHYQGERPSLSRTHRETEAEAVAFAVCQAVGIEAKDASADYIRLYKGDTEMLLKSLGRIQKVVREVVAGVLGEGEEGQHGQAAPAVAAEAA